MAVYGCGRTLTVAVVAVTVAVGDTSGPSGSRARGQARAITHTSASPALGSWSLRSPLCELLVRMTTDVTWLLAFG
jgi:hypothetical protein